jgi:hypothetical protein
MSEHDREFKRECIDAQGQHEGAVWKVTPARTRNLQMIDQEEIGSYTEQNPYPNDPHREGC